MKVIVKIGGWGLIRHPVLFFALRINKEHKGKLIAHLVLRWQCQRFRVIAHLVLYVPIRHTILCSLFDDVLCRHTIIRLILGELL